MQDSIRGKRKIAPFQMEAEDARMMRWKRLRKINIHQGLRQMMGDDRRFRGVQEPAIQAIMEGQSPIVVVMGTGGGKSLLFMLPAWCEPGGTSIVVVPLIALREDMKGRCEKMGIRCVEWNSQRPPDAASIVLVTPESAVGDGFRTYINRLRATQRLDRIVIDECHIVLNDQWNFRKELQQLGDLIGAESPMVLLTATLPPSKELGLWQRMHFQADEIHMFRAPTSRRNVRYQIVDDHGRKQNEQDEFVVRLVEQKSQRWSTGKMIVYCNSVKKSKRLAELLQCPVYHHHATDKAEKLQGFINGTIRIIVATSSLGLGLDVPDIRAIIHVDRPRNLLEYTQESGRAGRDGLFSEATIIKRFEWPPGGGSVGSGPEQDLVRRLMGEEKGSECRRKVLDEYMDGDWDRVMCEENEAKCDICRGSSGRGDGIDGVDCEFIEESMNEGRGVGLHLNTITGEKEDQADEGSEEDEVDGRDKVDEGDEGDEVDKGEEVDEGDEMEEGDEEDEQGKRKESEAEEGHRKEKRFREGHDEEEGEEVYRSQQQQRQHVRKRQQSQASQEGHEIAEFQRQLRRWQDRCPMCFMSQREDSHSLMQCRQENSQSTQEVYMATRQMIKYEKYSGCFQCGLPQGICQRYEQRANGGFWQLIPGAVCQYDGVVMSTLFGLTIGQKTNVNKEMFGRMKQDGVGIMKDEEVNQWLGGKIRWGGLECNRMVREFYRVVKMVESNRDR